MFRNALKVKHFCFFFQLQHPSEKPDQQTGELGPDGYCGFGRQTGLGTGCPRKNLLSRIFLVFTVCIVSVI